MLPRKKAQKKQEPAPELPQPSKAAPVDFDRDGAGEATLDFYAMMTDMRHEAEQHGATMRGRIQGWVKMTERGLIRLGRAGVPVTLEPDE